MGKVDASEGISGNNTPEHGGKSRQRFEDDQLRLCSRKSCCSNFLGHTNVEEAGWMGCSLQSVPHRSALCEEWSGSRKGKEED